MLRSKTVHHLQPAKQNVFVDESDHNYIKIPMYNLIEKSDFYSATPGACGSSKEMNCQQMMLV